MAQTQVIVDSTTHDSYNTPIILSTELTNTGVTTGASYADALTIEAGAFKRVVITMKETGGAQSFFYQVLGSVKTGSVMPASNDSSYVTLTTGISVAASGSAFETSTAGWKWLVVQVKNNSGSATVDLRARGVTQ